MLSRWLSTVVANNVFRVYNAKTLELVKTFSDHSDDVTDLAFGKDVQFIASTSLDRCLKLYS